MNLAVGVEDGQRPTGNPVGREPLGNVGLDAIHCVVSRNTGGSGRTSCRDHQREKEHETGLPEGACREHHHHLPRTEW